jgi:DNA-binding NarL/FixJ family response regulator
VPVDGRTHDLGGGVTAGAGSQVGVFLVEPQEVVRRGLVAMLGLVPEIVLFGSAVSLDHAAESCATYGPRLDLLILGSETDPRHVERLRSVASHTRLLVLLRDDDRRTLNLAAQLGADGYVLQPTLTLEELEIAIGETISGRLPLPRELARELLSAVHEPTPRATTSVPRTLTAREYEVLSSLVGGATNKQIARSLNISEHGVKRLIGNILVKLDCPNRTLAAARAIRERLVEPPPGTQDSAAPPDLRVVAGSEG